MAQRRMLSLKIVDTDAFLDMPQSSQLLYYHLAMRADDDGFVANPKRIMRMTGAQEDDYKVLVVKKFIIPFESGICVIKHWRIHNLIRGDRYCETQYTKEKAQLVIDPATKKYSLNKGENHVIPNGNHLEPQVRLGKVNNNDDSANAPSSLSKVSQEQTVTTFEQWLEDNNYETTEIYNGEEDGMVEAWVFPGVKRPQTREEMLKRYKSHLSSKRSSTGQIEANKSVLEVWLRFTELCERELGKKPVVDAKARQIIRFAIDKVGKEEVLSVIEEWFTLGRPDEETIQITRALSGHQINSYIARK